MSKSKAAAAPVVTRRDDWDGDSDEPLFTVEWPDESVSVDVHAADEAAALQLATDTRSQASETDAQRVTEQQVRDLLAQRVAQLEQAARGWASLTAAQKDAANRAAVRGVALLIRLQLRRLDATGD